MRPAPTGSPPRKGEGHPAVALSTATSKHDTADSISPFATKRRFLILAAMAGWVGPERVTERILAELDAEVAQ